MMIKWCPSLKIKYKPTWAWITRSVILIQTWKSLEKTIIQCACLAWHSHILKVRHQLTFFSFSVKRVICCLEMVTLSGHYPTRCTWRRKPYAHDINYWVIPGPGAVSGCFPGISIPQFSSYFGIKPKEQGTCVMCASCQDRFVQRTWNLSQSMLTLSVGCKFWNTLSFLLGTGFLAQRPTGIIPDCSLRAK